MPLIQTLQLSEQSVVHVFPQWCTTARWNGGEHYMVAIKVNCGRFSDIWNNLESV